MRIFGVDPGLALTGYAVLDQDGGGELHLVTYGVVRTGASLPHTKRLSMLYHRVVELLETYRPDAFAVEELFFAPNLTTAFMVGQARGVILLAAAEKGIPVYEYAPAVVKQAITGYGQAGKAQVQSMVRLLLRLPEVPRPDDAADAIAVAICHGQHARWNFRIEEGK